MKQEYINILKDNLEYEKIKILDMEVYRHHEKRNKRIKEYIYNQDIIIRYHLLADTEEIHMTIVKRGIHLDGTCDYKKITVFRPDLEELYSNEETNREVNDIKKKKRKR